ncbi:MAG: DUF1501 domain-containing protein [Deltaproteobacteria bacterium]|nr:MAG: DUF1501 domain-containing protein [Deltaproteobacteria bacterium]
MAITRRQFLKRSGAVSAAALLGPSLFTNPFVRRALADTIGDRYLVVLFLDGGNDGLNTVVPVDDGGGSLRTAYEAARLTGTGGLRLTPSDLGTTLIGADPNTGSQLGLHPGCTGFKQLYDAGKLAVIQGCGYPDYSLSHDQSRAIWMAGDPSTPGGAAGWVGKHLAANYVGSEIPAVCISDRIAGELRQSTTSVLAVGRLRDLGFPYDDVSGDDLAAKRAAVAALYDTAGSGTQSTIRYIGESGTATLLASESYPALDDLYVTDRSAFNDAYDTVNRSTARDLREIAKMIYGVKQGAANVHARFFQLANGGYDTHSDQGAADPAGQHYGLHKEVGDSLKVFYDDLADMGVADKVCLVVWSEFSRRVPQNDSGTDHGSQGPMFVIGGAVTGGVYGNHPNIDPAALDDNGNTVYSQAAGGFRSTDFRDVYGTILKHWLNVPAPTILSSVLPVDGGDPDTQWTAPNFDMGFLT